MCYHRGGEEKIHFKRLVVFYQNLFKIFTIKAVKSTILFFRIVKSILRGLLLVRASFWGTPSLAYYSLFQVYQNGVAYYCLMINSAGNVQSCSTSNVLCEKSLVKDARMCLNKTTLATSITTNQTTLINLPTYATASSCIEYCRGTIGNQVFLVCFGI